MAVWNFQTLEHLSFKEIVLGDDFDDHGKPAYLLYNGSAH